MHSNMLAGKRILLLYARFFGYDKIVKNKLESLGAHVDLYDARANINSCEKALRKVNDRIYIEKQKRFHEGIQKENAEKKYEFIFSNDVLDIEIIKNYRRSYPTAHMVLYIDDSVANMRGVEKTFSYYDRVLTFDKNDSESYGIDFRPLFYSDDFAMRRSKEAKIEYDISFVGTCHSDRLKIINSIQKNNPELKCYFFCYLQSWFMYYYHYLREPEYRTREKSFFQFKPLSMEKVADIMHSSRAIIDIQHPAQTGLTMRTIETLGLGKKLITTNRDIANYDFYNIANVCIIDRANPVIPEHFIDSRLDPLDQKIYEKYCLEGWIEDIFM